MQIEHPRRHSLDLQKNLEKKTLLIDESILAVGTLGCLSYLLYELPRLGDEPNHYIFFVRLGSYFVAVLGAYDFGSQFMEKLTQLHELNTSRSEKNTPSSSDQV